MGCHCQLARALDCPRESHGAGQRHLPRQWLVRIFAGGGPRDVDTDPSKRYIDVIQSILCDLTKATRFVPGFVNVYIRVLGGLQSWHGAHSRRFLCRMKKVHATDPLFVHSAGSRSRLSAARRRISQACLQVTDGLTVSVGQVSGPGAL